MADVNHRLRRMSGRDPHEQFRVATPLELLFDLTFVVGFGTAASEFARSLSHHQVGSGLAGFVFATFAVWWAWANFSWFASAYDTDDWVYRLATMVQMAGVIILALGLPQMFASMHEGQHVDNRVMVAGYVVMRIAMVAQWLRAAAQDPDHRPACLTYVVTVTVAQIGWVGVIFASASFGVTFLLMVPLRICCMRCSFTRGTLFTWCWSRSRRWCWSRRWPWPRAGCRWRCAW